MKFQLKKPSQDIAIFPFIWIAFLLAGSCDFVYDDAAPSEVDGAALDAGGEEDDDSGAESEVFEGCPPQLEDVYVKPTYTPLPTVLEAETIGDKVRFVDVFGESLLAERIEGDGFVPFVVLSNLWDLDGADSVEIVEFGEPLLNDARALAIASHVLVCGDDGCALWKWNYIGGNHFIVPFDGGEVPQGAQMRGIDWGPDLGTCVFGDGVFCFSDNGWRTVADAKSGPMFNAVTAMGEDDSGYFLAAVGDKGRMGYESKAGWQEMDSGTDFDLMSIASYSTHLLAVGQNGVLINGTIENHTLCELSQDDLFFMGDTPYSQWPDSFVGVTADGRVFRGPVDELEPLYFTGEQLGNVGGVYSEAWGYSINLLISTESALFGHFSLTVE